ncbi:hypothetical protein [Pyruvatibacter sp.]|uniref:hypothetical protein n=1 Tax=Pyruvatibacter sp. TaxID=1981328 RepID=UPI003266BB48
MRLDPQFAKYMIFAGSLAVLAAGLAREAFVINVGVGTVLQDLRQFNLDAENSVPAWWGSSMMLIASLLLYTLGANAWRAGDILWRLWLVLAIVFMALSIDEAASFHEGVIAPLRSAFGFGGLLFYAWIVPAFICVAGLGLALLPLLKRLPTSLFWKFAAYGGIFVAGALGMEMIGGWLDYQGYRATAFYALSISIEEGFELLGVSLFIAALLDQFDPARAVVGDYARHRPVQHTPVARMAAGAGQFPALSAD